MTRAAERLNLTQPAVSASIASIETAYQVKLFQRVGRRLELTDAGIALLPAARRVMQEVCEAKQALHDATNSPSGQLRIFASQTHGTYWLPGRLAAFAMKHPNVELTLNVGNTNETIRAIKAGDADLGFVEGSFPSASLQSRVLGHDELGIYGRVDHPFARRSVTRDDLMSASWVMREHGSGTREHFFSDLETQEIQLDDIDIRLVLCSNEAILGAICSTNLLGVVSRLSAEPFVRAGMVCSIQHYISPRRLHMLHRSDRWMSSAAAAFMTAISS